MANLADLTIGLAVDESGVVAGFDSAVDEVDEGTGEIVTTFDGVSGKLGKVAAAAGAAAGTALIAGAMESIERESSTDRVAAAMGLSPAEAKTVGDAAGNVFATGITDSFDDVTSAAESVMSTFDGLDQGGIEDATGQAIALSKAFGTDVDEEVGKAAALIREGLAGDATEAFDLITASSQEVPKAIRDELGDATKEYSKHFSDLGFTGSEMFGLLSQADDQFTLDKTGDAIKELSIRAADGSDASAEAFDAIGLDADNMQNQFVQGGDNARKAMDRMVDGLMAMDDPAAQAEAAVALFGTPLEDIGTQKIPDFLASLDNMGGGMGDTEGAAAQLGDTLGDNAGTKVQAAKNKFDNFLSSLAEAPGPIGSVTAGIAGIGSSIMPVLPAVGGMAAGFGQQLTSMAGSAAKSIGSVIASGASWVASTVAQGASALASMAVTSAKFVAKWAMMGIKSLIHAGKMAASWVIAMGPVGWVIAGIVALAALIIANWDKVVKWTRKAWTWVSEKVSAAWQWVKDTTSAAVGAVVGWFRSMRDKISDWIGRARDVVVSTVTNLKDRAIGLVSDLVSRVIGFYSDLYGGIWDWIVKAKDKVVGAVTAMKDRAVQLVGDLKDGAIDKFRGLMDWVRGMPDRFVNNIGNLGSLLWDKGTDLIEGLWNGISSMGSWLADKITGFVADKIPGPIARALGISSPSTVAADLAREVPKGLVVGMEAEARSLERAAERTAMRALPQLGVPRVPAITTAGAGDRPVTAGAIRDALAGMTWVFDVPGLGRTEVSMQQASKYGS